MTLNLCLLSLSLVGDAMVVMGHLQELLSLSPMYTRGIHVIKLLVSVMLIF